MEQEEYKLQFAQLLQKLPRDLRLNSQPMIAKEIVGKEDANKYPMFVMRIGEEWPYDSFVLAEVERLDKTPVEKEIVLGELYHIGTNRFVEAADRVKAFAEYAKISGWTMQKKDVETGSDDKLRELASMILTDESLTNG